MLSFILHARLVILNNIRRCEIHKSQNKQICLNNVIHFLIYTLDAIEKLKITQIIIDISPIQNQDQWNKKY